MAAVVVRRILPCLAMTAPHRRTRPSNPASGGESGAVEVEVRSDDDDVSPVYVYWW